MTSSIQSVSSYSTEMKTYSDLKHTVGIEGILNVLKIWEQAFFLTRRHMQAHTMHKHLKYSFSAKGRVEKLPAAKCC